jgi:hypothetical protein
MSDGRPHRTARRHRLLTAAFKAAGTLDAVAAVIGTSKRTLRQWLQWLAEHRPDEYAQLPRHPPNGSAE